MPRNKSITWANIEKASKQEFLEKGFVGASIRSIADKAGITSAGLYRHCEDKNDLFCKIVMPAYKYMEEQLKEHKENSMNYVKNEPDIDKIYGNNEMDILLDLMKNYPIESRLLFCRAEGTSFEKFVYQLIERQEKEMVEVLGFLSKQGYKAIKVSRKEMNMMISAYMRALLEPFNNGYTYEETKRCYGLLNEFFTPGWKNIMGF